MVLYFNEEFYKIVKSDKLKLKIVNLFLLKTFKYVRGKMSFYNVDCAMMEGLAPCMIKSILG